MRWSHTSVHMGDPLPSRERQPMNFKEVILTPYEMAVAAQVGVMRNIRAMRHSDTQSFSPDGNWSIHIEGSAGEMACAQALGCYWSGSVDTYRTKSDLGNGVEVRTRKNHEHDLIVREKDSDDAVFFLVTGKAPYFRVHGWILGSDAKDDLFRKDYGGHGSAFFVPQDKLNPIHEPFPTLEERQNG